MALAQLSGKKCLHFLRVWDAFRYGRSPFCQSLLKQFFTLGKEHQTRLISLNLLSQVSVLLRTAHRGQYRSKSVEYLCRYAKRRCRFGVLGARAFSSPQNFDSPHSRLPQDDTLRLETLWLPVTLSKAGCTVLSKGTHSKTPAASNLDEWR